MRESFFSIIQQDQNYQVLKCVCFKCFGCSIKRLGFFSTGWKDTLNGKGTVSHNTWLSSMFPELTELSINMLISKSVPFCPSHGSETKGPWSSFSPSLVTQIVVTRLLFLSGCERHVCGWEAWLPHVCVWVHSPLHQHPPGPQWPAEKGYSLWRDSDRGEEGVPGPPGCASCMQWILLAGAGRTDEKWLGGQLAWGGIVVWFDCVLLMEAYWPVDNWVNTKVDPVPHPHSGADVQVTHTLFVS